MNVAHIMCVMKKELRELLRDRRTLISTILIPVIAIPLLLVGMGLVAKHQISKMQESSLKTVVIHPEWAGELSGALAGMERLEIDPQGAAGIAADSLILAHDVKLVIEYQQDLEQAFQMLESTDFEEEAPEAPAVIIHYQSTDDEAKMAMEELTSRFTSMRSEQISNWLTEKKISRNALRPWTVVRTDVAPEQKRKSEAIASFLPYLILLLVVQSLAYPAMELTAGEKERHTIETLLVNPVSRVSIVLGKFLAIAVMGVGSAMITLASQLGFLLLAASRMQMMEKMQFELSPLSAAVTLLFLVPFTCFFAALMLLVCLYARSMKEAQSYVAPMMMLVIFPSMMSMIPGLELNWTGALVPVYNVTLMLREVLMQNWENLHLMVLVFVSNTFYALLSILAAVRLFRNESVIFRS